MNLSDVLFDTGKYTLRPLAREKLAKISGIVLAYPDLKLAIEGNTDSVGTDAMNQTLSEKRAGSVLRLSGKAKYSGGVNDVAGIRQDANPLRPMTPRKAANRIAASNWSYQET